MNTKAPVLIGIIVGGMLGSFIPSLWGASSLSFESILFSTVGSLAGIMLAYRMTR